MHNEHNVEAKRSVEILFYSKGCLKMKDLIKFSNIFECMFGGGKPQILI